ncbi:hypothetical protein [Pedobacter glucosidilyticus]|uniref:hypothetical protein n=1 Tax=Pedobacter glucosidilyticus TaxID=1122941 RepID=UPI00041B7803|nr:hypothetical protein [Pedobacter glucosidilyticus]
MEQSPKPKKFLILKWLLGVLLVVLLLLGSGAYYLNKQWKPLLTDVLQKAVTDVSDSLYKVKFSDIRINVLTGSAYIDSIHIYPDTAIYNKMIAQKDAPENLFELKINHLGLKNIHPSKIYFDRKLAIDAISILRPELNIIYTKLKYPRKREEDHRTTYQKIKHLLKSARVGTVFFNNVKFKYVDRSLSLTKPDITNLDNLNIRLNDILIDSAAQYDQSRIFTTKDIIAELKDYSYPTADSLYIIKLEKMQFSTLKKELLIKNFRLAPRYNEMAFSNLFEKQHERYSLSFDTISFKNVNYPALIDERLIAAQKVLLKKGDVSVFLNRGKASKGIDKGKNFPHLALQRVNWTIHTDTIELNNTKIAYAEYNPKTGAKGTISFHHLRGYLFNISNSPYFLKKNHFADAYLQTLFLGKGNLNVHIRFDLTDKLGAFSYKGSIGKMPMETINPITRPLAMVMVKSGTMNSLDFSAKGNIRGASGFVKINYQDLSVTLMKKDEDNNLKKMGLISLVANALLLKQSNPSKNEALRVSYPSYARPADGSFFNLMWKVIFTGLKESVGISKEQEEKIAQKASKLKEAKLRREKRKAERQKKKEDKQD